MIALMLPSHLKHKYHFQYQEKDLLYEVTHQAFFSVCL